MWITLTVWCDLKLMLRSLQFPELPKIIPVIPGRVHSLHRQHYESILHVIHSVYRLHNRVICRCNAQMRTICFQKSYLSAFSLNTFTWFVHTERTVLSNRFHWSLQQKYSWLLQCCFRRSFSGTHSYIPSHSLIRPSQVPLSAFWPL